MLKNRRCTIAVGILLAARVSWAATSIGSLGGGSEKVIWTDHFTNLVPYLPGAIVTELCPVLPESCHAFELGIGSVGSKDVAIAIGWVGEDQQADLYVYDSIGILIAQSTGIASQGESLVLRHPAAGTYEILVTGARIADLAYKGIAQIQDPVPATLPPATPQPLLPKLITPPPTDFHVSGIPLIPSNPLGFPIPADQFGLPTLSGSCYFDEVADPTAPHRCLRFTNDIANVGPGPLELQFHLDPTAPGFCVTEQVIHFTDGGQTTIPIPDGCELHPSHLHFHFNGFARYELYDFDPQNLVDHRGQQVGTGRKVGFCVTDVDPEAVRDRYGSSEVQPIEPRNYRFPNCNVPSRLDESGLEHVMGVTQGWGDVYTWDLPDQFIEVTGLPPGKYDVVSIANPTGTLAMDDGNVPANRSGHQWVCLTADAVRTIDEANVASEICPP